VTQTDDSSVEDVRSLSHTEDAWNQVADVLAKRGRWKASHGRQAWKGFSARLHATQKVGSLVLFRSEFVVPKLVQVARK